MTQAQKAATFALMLENCKSYDKDIRHTGAHDLCNEICKSTDPLEESLEKRICTAFISHLEDQSVDVKSNAVKCIQRTSTKIRESNLIMILQKLAHVIVEGKDDATLDIFSLTVRGIVNETREDTAEGIIETLQPYMLKGIEHGSN